MSKTIKYTGTQDPWPELAVTGKQSSWRRGQQEERPDDEAALLLATGLFDGVPIAVRQNSATGALQNSQGQLVVTAPITITGALVVGATLTASPAGGWQVTAGQWYRGASAISGATALAYTLTPADVGPLISFVPSGLPFKAIAGTVSTGSTGDQVGGYRVGDNGATGSLYEGFTLSFADDFLAWDVITPTNSRGRWQTTRCYGAGPRGGDTILGTMFDTDPFMTGHKDSNRGVPVGYSNMALAASVVSLQARKATAGEQQHMSSTRNEVAAMLAGPGAIHWNPGVAGTNDIIFESRVRFSAGAGNPAGWHPTMWLQSVFPVIAADSDELDWEGTSKEAHFNRNVWTGGVVATQTQAPTFNHDGQYHLVSMRINKSTVSIWIDGAQWATANWDGNSKDKPQYPLLTSHVYNGTFEGENYNQAAWNADGDGATMDVDYVRVWRRTGRPHYKALSTVTDRNVDWGASVSIVLPSVTALWGDAGVTDYVQAVIHEENEPGGSHSVAYSQFPAGVSYNAGTRTVTVDASAVSAAGRLNFIVGPNNIAGATAEPLRFSVNVGPRLTVAAQQFASGSTVSFDLYAACDCGVLTTNGTAKAKTISVSGLSGTGLSYSDSTGLLTGTYNGTSVTAQVTITNSLGQTVTAPLAISAAAAYAYASWTGDNVAWYDASDSAAVTTSGSSATGLTNKRGGGVNSNLSGAGAGRTYNLAAINGRNVISFARDTSNPARFTAGATTDNVCGAFNGNDKAFVAICVYRPTDANTAFIWSYSAGDGTNAKQIALLRRAAAASELRRQVVNGAPANVFYTDANGIPSGSVEIVAVKFSGTTATIWRNSTTPFVVDAAQDVGTFGTDGYFRLGAAMDTSVLATTACAFDFCEMLVQSGATRSNADIQQAITDLAAKWGKTLS
nr:glycoside hydrolase family 16 protein [uncultured Roseateles sp.]